MGDNMVEWMDPVVPWGKHTNVVIGACGRWINLITRAFRAVIIEAFHVIQQVACSRPRRLHVSFM